MSSTTSADGRPSPVPLLKTCQTCFGAKIRCEKTQDSDYCDRCLRLGKTCVFNPARRPRRRLSPSNRAPGRSNLRSRSRRSATPVTAESSIDIANRDVSFDPFQRGLLSSEAGQVLIDHFGHKMIPHFPFVVLSKDLLSVRDLNAQLPCTCLAVLAAASHAEPQLQQSLGRLFNQLVATRLAGGRFSDIDLLQGLLVHLAWAHYQPRPKTYTQHLHLATSIISDLRLDKPRGPKLWVVDGGKDRNELEWGPDEKRALAGAYYLSSCSSVVLQKFRQFSYTPYISRCCEDLALLDSHPTDRYLSHIIRLQSLIEKMEDLVSQVSVNENHDHFAVKSQEIAQECAEIKSSLPFSLSESPPLLLQVYLLELLLSQSSPHGTSFGLDRFQNRQSSPESRISHIDRLSVSVYSVRSLISVGLVLPPGEETAMSNLSWIMMYCGLSMAVRLDLIVARDSTPGQTNHLRRCLDVAHALRQVCLRLKAAAGSEMNSPNDHAPLDGLARRVLKLEEWYLDHANRQSDDPISGSQLTYPSVTMLDAGTDIMRDQSSGQATWQGASGWYTDDSGFDFGGVLFGDGFDFTSTFGP